MFPNSDTLLRQVYKYIRNDEYYMP